MEEYNRNNPNAQVDLKHLSHSLGVSSSKNAMNWANYKGMQFDNTTLTANTVGTSYPMTNNTIGGRLSFGLYDQGYTEKASSLFRDGKVEYAVAPGDIVGTGLGLPYLLGSWSIGIGNTDTTGDDFPRMPGTHYQDEMSSTKKSGLMGSGFGFTIGSKKEQIEQDRTQQSATRSQVGSLSGDTTIQAGNHYQQT
ncbi:TPA: hypothetical protein ACU18R_002464, partial [Mannheimia haemolytica]